MTGPRPRWVSAECSGGRADGGAGSKGFHGASLGVADNGAIGVTIVTEVNIAIYDARSEPTRVRTATRP